MKGVTYVKANNAWLPKVMKIAMNTHIMFMPVLSTTKPQKGEPTAEIRYTILDIPFAFVSLKSYFLIKKTLRKNMEYNLIRI